MALAVSAMETTTAVRTANVQAAAVAALKRTILPTRTEHLAAINAPQMPTEEPTAHAMPTRSVYAMLLTVQQTTSIVSIHAQPTLTVVTMPHAQVVCALATVDS